MARVINEIQAHEVRAYGQFCIENNIINDGSDEDIENSNLVHNYFVNTWGEMITPQTLAQAFPHLRPYLKLKTPARLEAERLAQGYADTQALAAWFDKQTLLIKDGDEGYRNFSELIQELQGHPATQVNIDNAIASIQYATGGGGAIGKYTTRIRRPLSYVQRQTERPKSFHQQTDDGSPFLGKDVNLTPAQHRERARAAYAEPETESPSTIRGREQAAAKSEAEAMRGNTHSETDQIQKLFVYDQANQEIDWVKTRDARRSMQRWFERRRAVSMS
jgi:hypothetical protein